MTKKQSANPFLTSFKLNVIEIQEEKKLLDSKDVNWEEGYVLDYITQKNVFHVEQQKHVKIYDIPYDHSFFFKEFQPTTRDLYNYIILKLKENQDWIELNYKKVTKETSMSIKSFYSATKQLAEFSVITKKQKDQYWINPYYMFRGNRLNFFKEFSPKNITTVNKTIK